MTALCNPTMLRAGTSGRADQQVAVERSCDPKVDPTASHRSAYRWTMRAPLVAWILAGRLVDAGVRAARGEELGCR